jgi:hypothetical protein
MTEHRPEVADVFRRYEKDFFEQWGHVVSPQQRRAFEAIRDCRTAALGGHVEKVEQCDTCGHLAISYNSCRNRHCPKCQAMARAQWLDDRQAELLPVPYFHVVFTLPQKIGALALQNAREIYGILFRAASETLLTIAADPKRLGASLGFLAVLLTHYAGVMVVLSPDKRCIRLCLLSMGAEPPSSSAPALRRAGRRTQPGWQALGFVPQELVPSACASPEQPFPKRLSELPEEGV